MSIPLDSAPEENLGTVWHLWVMEYMESVRSTLSRLWKELTKFLERYFSAKAWIYWVMIWQMEKCCWKSRKSCSLGSCSTKATADVSFVYRQTTGFFLPVQTKKKFFPPQIMGNNTCFTIHTVSSLLGGVMSKTFVITIIIFISNSLDHLLLTCTIRIISPKLQYRLCKLLIVSL